jgi:type IV pilus assembly protein PilE
MARSARTGRGFTLIELMMVTGLVGVLASVAYPSFQGAVLKARRIDAVSSLVQAQLAQERWRSSNAAYASAAELRLPARSSMGYYDVDVSEVASHEFVVTANARGSQAADRSCRVMQIHVVHGVMTHRSGVDAQLGNSELDNRRCWNL